jgi:hypothetical protein
MIKTTIDAPGNSQVCGGPMVEATILLSRRGMSP